MTWDVPTICCHSYYLMLHYIKKNNKLGNLLIFEGKLLHINDMQKHTNFYTGHLVLGISLLSFSKLAVVVVQYTLKKRHNVEWCRLWFGPSFQRCCSLGAAQDSSPSWILQSLQVLDLSWVFSICLSTYSLLQVAGCFSYSSPQTWAFSGCSHWRGPVCWLCSHCTHPAWRYWEKETALWTDWAFLVNKGGKRRSCKMLAMYECFIHKAAFRT